MLSIEKLTVERRTDPLGIDAQRPRFSWQLMGNGDISGQSRYQLQVVDTDAAGASWSTPTWDSGRRDDGSSTYVEYDGPPLQSRHRYQWRVRLDDGAWSEPASFEMGLLEPEDWTGRWISHVVPDLVSEPEDLRQPKPAPALSRTFGIAAAPHRARLYITALGLYETFINGTRVGKLRLMPGWTDYHSRLEYQTYDVTPLLREGENVLSVTIADGWYAGTVGAWGKRRYGDVPMLLCQLEVQLTSGESMTVASDASWTGSETGTWLHDLQLGERTDLRTSGVPHPVTLRAAPGIRLLATRDEGVQDVEVLPAREVTQREPGRYIVDLGENAAGVLRLHVNGRVGQHVVIRHAEALDAQGELYVENLRGAEQQDEFILAGSGAVELEPRFTFHGFRFAEVRGVNGSLQPQDVELHVLSSATRLIGSFSCSDPAVNQLQSNIVRSLRANFLHVPTDCPQRNERLGWTADLQIFAPTALFNAELTNMLDKWMDDLVDAQLPSGAYVDVAPLPPGFSGWGNTAWSDAGIIVPWVMYERAGDAQVLRRLYDSMLRYMRFLEADQTDGLRFGGRYGDWVSLGAKTDKTLIGTAYLAYVADLFTRIATVVGKSADAQHYRQFSKHVRDAFQARFVRSDGLLNIETQTAYAMAIGFDLLPESSRTAAGDRLAQLVKDANTHIATGFLGTPLVMPALSDTGHHELACQLLRQDTYPSWLFEVKHGATSIWERWNGWTPENGFFSPRMNSFNHYAFGAVGDWMYRYLAGLRPVEPGYRRVELRPRPGAGFTTARATHESLYGVHECSWQLTGDALHVEAQVPPNTTARLFLPGVEAVELGPGRHVLQSRAGVSV